MSMKFRPCIDLHHGKVKQIVGSSLTDNDDQQPVTNFESNLSAADFAKRYQKDGLTGGHIISLGTGNEEAALAALQAYPGGLQYGGGVTLENAKVYLNAGASHVIVTSYVFREGQIDWERLHRLVRLVGKERLVLDLSCKKRSDSYVVMTNRWQTYTSFRVNETNLRELSRYCDEFLIHAVDVEGKCEGIEDELVMVLGTGAPIPVTYAGGVRSFDDLERIKQLGNDRVDVTIGSALDLFGGHLSYEEVIRLYS